jgi:hypothetical protein
VPDFVPAIVQAHARGLLMFDEAAKLLDIPMIPDLIDAVSSGEIECERINNLPCFSLAAIDAYRRHHVA